MKLQEKKYLVESFTEIIQLLKDKGAEKIKEIKSIHYYGHHEGNNVEKFVEYFDRFEIHILDEISGQFVIKEHRLIPDKNTGFTWLKNLGYTTVDIIKMDCSEYKYINGTVGLYVIDNFLNSIILYYPPVDLENMEKEFRLNPLEVIKLPYNKYLNKVGKLKSIKLVKVTPW
ncbi:MAG: hypothetical protein NUV87_02315 [Candidatus Roizmanbacteria bacterium]|nr:hypothetical protein [Candidatus Roizmanbacteria bacterium]